MDRLLQSAPFSGPVRLASAIRNPERMLHGLELLRGLCAERHGFRFGGHPGGVECARLRRAGVVDLGEGGG